MQKILRAMAIAVVCSRCLLTLRPFFLNRPEKLEHQNEFPYGQGGPR